MCYSAEVRQAYEEYVRRYGAVISLREFAKLYARRKAGAKIRTTKAMDDAFLHGRLPAPADADGAAAIAWIAALIEDWNAQRAADLERQLFQQRTRLSGAERALRTRATRKALDDQRIAGNRIDADRARLADLRRTVPEARDTRLFPGGYAPVMVMEEGRRVIKPMRYQCRPPGRPASHDARFPGTYNARRDNLEGYWRGLFGHHHGVLLADAFFENVPLHRSEGRDLAPGEAPRNVVLEFRPATRQPMLVACLYSHWHGPDGDDLLSFAAITDTPPPEVAAAGGGRRRPRPVHRPAARRAPGGVAVARSAPPGRAVRPSGRPRTPVLRAPPRGVTRGRSRPFNRRSRPSAAR